MQRQIERIRNIGIIAHIDAGKTTTTERILFYTNATHRMGNVDDGNTVTDFDPEEAARGITIYSAAISCRWNDHDINIIDTPGHVDFTAEVERSLRVLDGGVVIFSAVEGVEAQSETVWRQANRYHVPRICFINKLDRIGAGFERVFQAIADRLQATPLALTYPIGEGPATTANGFRGVIDLIDNQALYFDPETQGKVITRGPIPADLEDTASEWRGRILETAAMLDDAVFAVYDATGDIPAADLRRLLRQATLAGQVQPLFCGAAQDYIGVQPLLDGVVSYLPSPADLPPVKGTHPKKGNEEVRKAGEKDPVAGLIFKVQVDRNGELYFVRVYSGVLKSKSRLLNPRTGDKEMISQLWKVQADSKTQVEEVGPGDIIAVIGPKDSVTGDTLCDAAHPVLLESITFPESVISMAVEPESSADRKKLEDTLRLLGKQDPTFAAKISEETGQTIISGMGELHLDIISKRMQRDFALKIRVHKPRVTYRESVRSTTRKEAVFERMVGGSTQYAAITVQAEPWSGTPPVTVDSQIKPGSVPAEWVQLVLKCLKDELHAGGLAGYPLLNVKLTLIAISGREGETSDVALQAVTSQAVRGVLEAAGMVLLEPIMRLEVVTPNDFVGNVTADLNSRRAEIQNTELRGNLMVITAEAPLAEMFGYSTQVRSMSQGRASYSMEPCRYGEAPPAVVKQVLGDDV